MPKKIFLLILVVSFAACGDSATSTTSSANGKAPDSSVMVLDSTPKIDTIKSKMDTGNKTP